MVKIASLACVAVLALVLAGCTSDPAPEPDALATGPSATEQAADPTPIPSEEPLVVSTWRPEDFPCHPVEGRSLDWLERQYNPSDAAMVEVGAGNQPGETWWIVAATGVTTGLPPGSPPVILTWLTNWPGEEMVSGDPWIAVGLDIYGSDIGFRSVDWPPEKIAKAEVALSAATACLDVDA